MTNLHTQPLSTLIPTVTDAIITVKIDKIYNREFVWIIGSRRSPMKELISIDVIAFDQEGSKMVMKLMFEDARDIFMACLEEGSSFEIAAPIVETGGEGLDNRFHIVLHASCRLKKTTDLCFSFPYTIKIPFQIEQGKLCPNGFFDVVGFLYQISPVAKIKSNNIWAKQIEVVLGTWDPICTWIPKNIHCVLRGFWIEAVSKSLNNVVDIQNSPFIHIRYVVMEAHSSSGSTIVSSYFDATLVDIDPNIQEIQELKENMFDMSVDF